MDRIKSADNTDGGSSEQGPFSADNSSVMVNPLLGGNLLIDLGSPTHPQASGTTNLASDDEHA